MTLALTIVGRCSLWALADRRLCRVGGAVVRDDAVKLMRLERGDDVGLLAYAGLGATAAGTEPSEWMNGVLRGRNVPLERSLHVLGKAVRDQVPKHLRDVIGISHSVIAPAFIDGQPHMFAIQLKQGRTISDHDFRVVRFVTDSSPPRPIRLAVAGAGEQAVLREHARLRYILRLVAAHERHRISPWVVADELARLNADVARSVKSVGPDCIVVWGYQRKGPIKFSPADQCYSGTTSRAHHLVLRDSGWADGRRTKGGEPSLGLR